MTKDCSWKNTRTGSNGGDCIDYDPFVSGGFPMVSLTEGQTVDSDGCAGTGLSSSGDLEPPHNRAA